MYQSRNRAKAGARFSDLLLNVANISPDLRVRFTSPHPKDFPEDVLAVVGMYAFFCVNMYVCIYIVRICTYVCTFMYEYL
jgi:tRNA A37 methylthiotransferase MiaB